MRQGIWILTFLFVLCFASLMLINIFVPSVREQENLLKATDAWGVLAKSLVALGTMAIVGIIALRFFRRLELHDAPWPVTPMPAESRASEASVSEVDAYFEKETETWILSAGGKHIAAFREIQGKLGDELRVFDRRYTVSKKVLRFGATLFLDDAEVAEGKQSRWGYSREIVVGDKKYVLKEKSSIFSGRHFRMMLSKVEVCHFERQRRDAWKISGIRDVEIHLVVFAFWLIRRPISAD